VDLLKPEVVEERVKAERRAIEADFERRVRQRTEACDQSRRAAEEKASEAEKQSLRLKAELKEREEDFDRHRAENEAFRLKDEEQTARIQSLETKLKECQAKNQADQQLIERTEQLQARFQVEWKILLR